MSRPTHPRRPLLAVLLPVFVLAGCSGDTTEQQPRLDPQVMTPASPDPAEGSEGDAMADGSTGAGLSVQIVAPADGATVNGGDVTVRLSHAGFEIRPAGDMTAGSGHHHIFLDADVSQAGIPIPAVPNSVIHLGDGSAQYTFTNVAAGQHRVIAVVADGAHVPLQPWVTDTVSFEVH